MCTRNVSSTFSVLARDRYGNPREARPDEFRVLVTTDADLPPLDSAQDLSLATTKIDYVENTCSITYTIALCGIVYIHVLLAASNLPVTGSPYRCESVKQVIAELFMPHEMDAFRESGVVDRRQCGFSKFPVEILQLTNLQRLLLADNQLKVFPKGLSRLWSLCELDVSRNSICRL
jgi:Leucine-rich repeat (LRR) protein